MRNNGDNTMGMPNVKTFAHCLLGHHWFLKGNPPENGKKQRPGTARTNGNNELGVKN